MAGNVRTPSTTTERNFQVKTKEDDSQAAYLEDKIDGSTYINITENDGTYGKKLVVEADISAINGGVTTDKVKVSGADATAEYLEDKITAGTGIEATCDDDTVTVALDAELKHLNDVDDSLSPNNKEILVWDEDTEKWKADFTIEESFSGTEYHVPSSDAISDLLQTLIVTNDADLGDTGTAIMYERKDIDASRMMIVDKDSTDFVDNYPAVADLIATVPNFRSSAADVLEEGYDRLAFGHVKIGSAEDTTTPSQDTFAAALIRFMLDEDYISGEDIYLDVMFKLASTSGADWETKVKAFPYYIQELDVVETALTPVEINMQWNVGGAATSRWKTFTIGGITSETKPASIAIFLACMSEDGTFTDTPINNATIAQARVRYKKKTLQLRTADVSM